MSDLQRLFDEARRVQSLKGGDRCHLGLGQQMTWAEENASELWEFTELVANTLLNPDLDEGAPVERLKSAARAYRLAHHPNCSITEGGELDELAAAAVAFAQPSSSSGS